MIQMTDAIVVNAMGEYMLVNGMLIVNKLFQCELCEDVWKIINYDKRVVLKWMACQRHRTTNTSDVMKMFARGGQEALVK